MRLKQDLLFVHGIFLVPKKPNLCCWPLGYITKKLIISLSIVGQWELLWATCLKLGRPLKILATFAVDQERTAIWCHLSISLLQQTPSCFWHNIFSKENLQDVNFAANPSTQFLRKTLIQLFTKQKPLFKIDEDKIKHFHRQFVFIFRDTTESK